MSLDASAAPAEPVADTPTPTPEPAKIEAPKADKAAEKAAVEKSWDDDLRSAYRNANRERGEDGKFSPKDGNIAPPKAKAEKPAAPIDTPEAKDTAKDAKPVESKTVQTPETKPSEPAKTQPPAIAAPASWTSEMKAKWATLPSEAQQYIAQREQESHGRISELGQYAKRMEPIREVLDHHKDYLRNVAMPPPELLSRLLDASRRLDTGDAVGVVRDLIQNYKIDPFQLLDDGTQAQPDPNTQRLQSRIDQLERQLQGYTAQQERAAQAQRDAQSNAVLAEIETFAKDKADWAELQEDLFANIAAIRKAKPNASHAEVLQEAYDRARWANPTTRARLQQETQAKAEAQRVEEAKRISQQARSAASINVSGSPRASVGPSDLDTDLRSIWRKRNAG